jgi:hypothetical protein
VFAAAAVVAAAATVLAAVAQQRLRSASTATNASGSRCVTAA